MRRRFTLSKFATIHSSQIFRPKISKSISAFPKTVISLPSGEDRFTLEFWILTPILSASPLLIIENGLPVSILSKLNGLFAILTLRYRQAFDAFPTDTQTLFPTDFHHGQFYRDFVFLSDFLECLSCLGLGSLSEALPVLVFLCPLRKRRGIYRYPLRPLWPLIFSGHFVFCSTYFQCVLSYHNNHKWLTPKILKHIELFQSLFSFSSTFLTFHLVVSTTCSLNLDLQKTTFLLSCFTANTLSLSVLHLLVFLICQWALQWLQIQKHRK